MTTSPKQEKKDENIESYLAGGQNDHPTVQPPAAQPPLSMFQAWPNEQQQMAGAPPPAILHAYRVLHEPIPDLLHPKFHKKVGSVHAIVGICIAIVEIIGLLAGPTSMQFGNGIYCGVILAVSGLLIYFASVKNNRGLLIAGMVLEIITAVVLVVGLLYASVEIRARRNCIIYYDFCWFYRPTKCQHAINLIKAGLVIAVCCVEFVLSIVHSGFSCHDLCKCCQGYGAGGHNKVIVAAMNPELVGQEIGAMPWSSNLPLNLIPYRMENQMNPPPYPPPYLNPSEDKKDKEEKEEKI